MGTFNLAVAYHMASKNLNPPSALSDHRCIYEMQIRSQKMMQRALCMYQYSFRLQRAQAGSAETPLFFSACMNNIGVLFNDLGDSTKAIECFKQLFALLMYLSSIGFEDPANYELLFRNTSRLGYETCDACAAA